MSDPTAVSRWHAPLVVIACGCAIALLGFGPRSVLGLFLEPMGATRGWGRETFGLAMAIQNLLWGLGVPVAGALADRYGPTRVLGIGALLYAAGLTGMALAPSAGWLHLSGGLVTGIGVAFSAFSIALAAMARVVGPDRRSMVLGLGTAAGSAGQVVFSPLAQAGIAALGWQPALLLIAASTLAILPLALLLPKGGATHVGVAGQSIGAALREALAHRGYVLLTLGFFVCGFQVAFITVHFPAYLRDLGFAPEVGAWSIAIVGLFNIAGSLLSGVAGQHWPKRLGLAVIYLARSLVIVAMLLLPKGVLGIYLFAATMGLLWLSTVPLTSGIVAQVFGVRYLATLFGVVFLSHQFGSFLGVWLGGRLYDATGSYDPVWWASVALGVAAALIHLPINERPLARLAGAPG